MPKLSKSLSAALAGQAGEATYVDDVFSTYLYEATGTTNIDIVNNIDLAGEGGLVWLKSRTSADGHNLFDTERGANKDLNSNDATAENTDTNRLNSFNSDGFQVGTDNTVNNSGDSYASWTFRKAPGFFDVVTYTGTGSAHTISHNLGCEPAFILVKSTDQTSNWFAYHKSLGATKYMYLDLTSSAGTSSSVWNDTAPTSTEFTVGTLSPVNGSGNSFVAYLFADGDDAAAQIFGTDGNQAVVKCGSYTHTYGTDTEINIGWEPQFFIGKRSSGSSGWRMYDNLRDFGQTSAPLNANLSNAEAASDEIYRVTSTGFIVDGLESSGTYIYIAIRRPHKPAESGTEVFSPITYTADNTDNRFIDTGILADMVMARTSSATSTNGFIVGDRLRGNGYLGTATTGGSSVDADSFMTPTLGVGNAFSSMNGFGCGNDATRRLNYSTYSQIAYAFKRSPGFFDMVTYTGNETPNLVVNHNLGVVPELMIFKVYSGTSAAWNVAYDYSAPTTSYMYLNGSNASMTATDFFNAAPTETTITLDDGTKANGPGYNYIAYLFASQDGISKVGSYTGNGTSQTIDCGFSSGARFVLIKGNFTNDWHIWDSERGIVAGNDPSLALNNTNAENSSYDTIDPDSSGFIVNQTNHNKNYSGNTYIYLAIA